MVRWCCPPGGFYKINWDVTINTYPNRMGVGVIIRNSEGRVIAALSIVKKETQEPAVGEATAALLAMEFGRDIGVMDVILEGDSLQVIKAINVHSPN